MKHALFSCIFLNDMGSPHLAFIGHLLSTLSFIGQASSSIIFVFSNSDLLTDGFQGFGRREINACGQSDMSITEV